MAKAVRRLTAAQLAALRLAASRPNYSLEPLPAGIRGAARQAVIKALVADGYALRCHFPTHVEYSLTDAGLALGCSSVTDDTVVNRPLSTEDPEARSS